MLRQFLLRYAQQNSFKNPNNKIIYHEESSSLVTKENKLYCKKHKFLAYISISKIVSSFGVIVLHLNGFWNFNINYHKIWNKSNFYQSLFYYPVPIFVLCIGATLSNFNERYGLLEYNKKRIIKVFIPLIGWTFTLYLYKAYILKNISKINFTFASFWNYFFLSKIYHIFKSLHIFILTYMLIPLIVFVEKSNKKRIYEYYFFLLLVTQSIIPYLITLSGNKIVWIYDLKIGYLIYIFAGYIIHNNTFSQITRIIIYLLGICAFFVDLIGTKILTYKHKRIILVHKGYLNLPCILYSCAIFLFIKEHSNLILMLINQKYIIKIGSLTLGPFFMHLALKETLILFPKLDRLINFNVLLNSLFIFSICIILSALLKKIPLIKILVP